MRPARAVAAFDSAPAMLRATARALAGQDFGQLGHGRAAALTADLLGRLPDRPRRTVYTVSGALEGVPPRRLGAVDLEHVAEWVTGHYPDRQYPAVFLGASNGAVVHICAELGTPWLPQTVLVPVRRPRTDPHDVGAALAFGRAVAAPLLERNPEVVLHHMHDNAQDRLMVRHMAYFRLKRTRLGDAYTRFLDDHLAPGAPVVVVDDRSTWPTTRVDERHVFQTGARGGLSPEQYAGPAADEESPEAEWGLQPALVEDVERWAAGAGHPVYRLVLSQPESLSPLVADLLRQQRQAADRLLVESFVLLDPVQARRTGATPYWTVFPVRESFERLDAYLRGVPAFRRVDALLFNHGTASPGLASAACWQGVVERGRRPGRLLGVDPRKFPADFASLARYGPALRALPSVAGDMHPVTLDDVRRRVQGHGGAYGAGWQEQRAGGS